MGSALPSLKSKAQFPTPMREIIPALSIHVNVSFSFIQRKTPRHYYWRGVLV
jgi:hypothetical protein